MCTIGEHSHCTAYRGQVSTEKTITASIVHGPGLGPASYVIAAGDLKSSTILTV